MGVGSEGVASREYGSRAVWEWGSMGEIPDCHAPSSYRFTREVGTAVGKFGFVFYKLIEPLISSQLHVLDGLGNSKN